MQESELHLLAQSANNATTILKRTNKSILIEWSLKSIADSARNTHFIEKQSKVRRQYGKEN